MNPRFRFGAIGAIIVLLIAAVALQVKIDPMRHEFEPKTANVGSAVKQLPIEFALGAATGFREAIAGLLWVRTDEFFHNGDYDAVVPMVRIVTWLDPHNSDVYQTGAWHLDYNFTDTDQRSDRRYLPFAISLLEEGIANNPTNSGMYADLAFTHFYRKVEDYPQAINWFEKGQALSKTDPDGWDVTAVGHGLGHAYESAGMIDKAIAQWKLVIAEHQRRLAKFHQDNIDGTGMQTAEKNLKEVEGRAKWRATMTQPPIDPNFDVTVTRIAPMSFVVNGKATFIGSKKFILETGEHEWGPINGCRVEVRLQDADYKMPTSTTLGLNAAVDKSVSIMQDSITVSNGKFFKKFNLAPDHTGAQAMYPFAAPKYTMTFWFCPANVADAPPNVGDRIGYLGEGLTSKNASYLDTSGVVPGTPGDQVPGLRMLKKTITLTQDDILGSGIKEFH